MAQELRNTLAEMVRQTASASFPTPNQTKPIAREILSVRPGLEPVNREAVKNEDPRGPSAINRIIDVLSRPLYAVTNPVEAAFENESLSLTDIGSEIWEGVSGKDKVLGSDVLEAAGVESGVERGVAGFGLDVLLDPLTYVGVGLASKLGRASSKSIDALDEVEDVSGNMARDIAADIEQRAATEESLLPKRTFTAGPGPTRRAELTTGPQYGEPPSPTVLSKKQVQDDPRVFQSGQPPGSAAIVGTADTIASPIPKPTTAREALEELAAQETGPGYQRLIHRKLEEMPPGPGGRQNVADILRDLAKAETNPVAKNMINQQLRKVETNVNPAETMVGQAGRPIRRPPIQLSERQIDEANQIADDFVKKNKFDEITPPGQQRLLERIQGKLGELKVPKKQRPTVALNMLRQAEEYVINQGKKLVDNQGNSVRLSDIGLSEGGITTEIADKFRKNAPEQSIENVRALSAATVASEVAQPVIETARKVATNVRDLPPARVEVVENEVARELGKIAEAAGASKHEANKAKEFVRELFDYSQDDLISESQKQARNMMRITATGKNDADAIHSLNKAVYDSLQGNPKVMAKVASFQPKVVEAIMTRFATWWNAKDLRPYAREYIDSARNIAAAFEQAMTPLVRATTKSQRKDAWTVATGKLPPSNPADTEIATTFKTTMEKLLGAEGVKTNAGNSVVTRSGVTMRELNEELKRGRSELRFTNGKGIDEFGNEFDYSGENWLNSWKEWAVDDPPQAIYELTRALQLATRKNSMLDDAAARWGQPIQKGEFNTPVNIPRLDGFYFPKEIANQLNAVWKRIQDDKFNPGGKFMQNFDRVQRAWKSGVTIYSPSHHIRNLNGDVFLNMLDGVMFTNSYTHAAKVLHAHRRRYKDLEQATNMTDPKWRRVAATQPGDTVVTTAGGHKLTAQQIMIAAENQGFLLKAPLLEDLIEGARLPIGLPGKARGRAHGVAAGVSESRDHFVRLAHFIELLKKDKSKNLRNAFDKAGQRVKKFHPDGSDLTGFEMTVMRRLIPFYSWLRKSTPLIIEGIAMRPHVSLAMPKAMSAIQEMTGVESEGPGNPFPVDSMFPDWIKEKGIGPIFDEDHPMADLGRQQTWRGEAPGYTIVNPTSPFIDQMKELFNPVQSIHSGLTPGLRIPSEIITGRTALDIPFESVPGGLPGHLAQQVPPVGIAARVSGATRKFNPGGRPGEPWHPEQLINWLLTGGLVTGTGPYEGQAQLEIREHLRKLGEERRG